MKRELGYVLVLAEEDNKILVPIVTRLQKKYENAPPFQPHLTIHNGAVTELQDAVNAVEQVTSGLSPFTVENIGFGYEKDRWSRILYIAIKENETLTRIHNEIGQVLNSPDPKPFIPHISLMYKNKLDDKVRQEIIGGLDLPKTFTVSGIEIVYAGETHAEYRNYAKWVTEYRKEF